LLAEFMLPAHFKSKPPHFLAPKGTGSLAAAASPRPACPPRSHSSCRGSLPQVFAFWHRCAASHSKSLLKRRRRPPMAFGCCLPSCRAPCSRLHERETRKDPLDNCWWPERFHGVRTAAPSFELMMSGVRDAQIPPFQNTRSKAQQSSFASWKRVLPQWICEIPIYAEAAVNCAKPA
jgi:hypothetical protein